MQQKAIEVQNLQKCFGEFIAGINLEFGKKSKRYFGAADGDNFILHCSFDLNEGIDDAYLGVVKRRIYDNFQRSNE